jgi:RNA polymerase sigma-70 factor (ECF subfamily)
MGDAASTRPSLLIRVRDPQDAEAWGQFVALYGPLIYQFARKQGLQDADAADLTQIVLQAVIEAMKRLDYDPQRGSFRSWLYQVARNQLSKFRAQQRKSPRGSGDSDAQQMLDELPDADPGTIELWDREYERQLFLWAGERVKARCDAASWQAFWRTAVDGQGAQEVARSVGMSVGAVYTARSRILDRIRKEIQQAQGDEPFFPRWDRDESRELS